MQGSPGPTSLIPPQPPTRRLSRRFLGGLFFGLVLLGFGFLLYKLNTGPDEFTRRTPPIPEDTGTGTLPSVSEELRLPKTYAFPKDVQQAESPPAQPGGPPPAHQVQPPPAQPRPGAPPPPSFKPPPPPGVIQVPSVTIQQGPPPVQRGPGAAPPAQTGQQAAPKKAGPHRWFTSGQPKQAATLEPPLKDDPKEAEAESKLFQRAVWERPAEPYKILYADQIVQVSLVQSISSDEPGTVRMKVTEPVMDRWGHQNVVIPLDTTFIAEQGSQTNYGQTRLPLGVYLAILPSGTAIQWQKGQVGDEMGRAGLPMEVDNHYVKLVTGVLLQAVLNWATRAPQSLGVGQIQQGGPQDFAQDAARGVNQAGQRLLDRFNVRPTLTQEHGFPATLSFRDNVSFQTSPVLIKK